jgi:hypothetical protein
MSIFTRFGAASLIAAAACCFLSVSTLTAQSQGSGTATILADLSAGAKEGCLDIYKRLDLLNAGSALLAQLKSSAALGNEEAASQARQVWSDLYEIRRKPSCNTIGFFYTGGYFLKDRGGSHIEEVLDANGHVTNKFHLVKDPLGFGIDAGFYYSPWNNAIRVGPFLAFDIQHLPIYQTFAGGQYLGTTSRWSSILGLKVGTMMTPEFFGYGLTGVSLLNQDMKIFLGGPTTSRNTTVPGFTLGLGAEYRQPTWRFFGKPLAVYAEYSHTWWQTAHLNLPPASPPFDYNFKRDDDSIKLGLHIYLNDPAQRSSPPIIGK